MKLCKTKQVCLSINCNLKKKHSSLRINKVKQNQKKIQIEKHIENFSEKVNLKKKKINVHSL